MHCFQVTEKVNMGFPIIRDGYPHVPTPKDCPQLLLETAVVDAMKDVEACDLRYGVAHRYTMADDRQHILSVKVTAPSMGVEIAREHVLLKRPTPRSDRMALVRIETAAGEGGKVFLTPNVYDMVMKKSEARREYRPFPSPGIQVLAADAHLERVHKGVEFLDVLAVMYPGASVRIFRNGRLEGASPQMFVHWNGAELRASTPRRYDDRASAGFFEAAAG